MDCLIYGNFTRSCIPDSFLIPDNFHHIPDQDNGISHIHIPNPYHLLLANDDKRTEHIKANISNMNPRKNALFLQPLQIPGMIYNFQEFLNVIPSDTYYDVILHPEDYHNEELLDNLPSLLGSQFRVFNSQIDSLSFHSPQDLLLVIQLLHCSWKTRFFRSILIVTAHYLLLEMI